MRRYLTNAACAAVLFLLNVALNWFLFVRGETTYRGSIERGYAAMARFVAESPSVWGWNPRVYCGLPTQFTYLPMLSYLSTAFGWLAPGEPEHVYRLITAALTCLLPASVFFLVLYFTRSRAYALAAGLTLTFFSPLYTFVNAIDQDRGLAQLPWRVQAMYKYGEGPHNAGLFLLPIAIIAAHACAVGRSYWRVFTAATLLAAVTLTNWVAALALAWCCLMLLVAHAGLEAKTGFRPKRFFAAAALGYLLAAFWLTPTFVQTTAFNWPLDAFQYNLGNQQWLLMAILGVVPLVMRIPLRWFPQHSYLYFTAACTFGFGLVVLVFDRTAQNTIPESRRYALEFELFLVLFVLELLRLGRTSRVAELRYAAVLGAVFFYAAGVKSAWLYAAKDPAKLEPMEVESSIEYQLARWLNDQQPGGRVFASGGLRYKMNAWFPLQQTGGTFESGLKNRVPHDFSYQISTGIGSQPGEEGRDAVWQLRAMGAEYVVVHGPRSEEYYRDFRNPHKFEGVLQEVYRKQDDVIYRVPFNSLAVAVRPLELPQYPPIHGRADLLGPLIAAMDDPQRPKLQTAWSGPNVLRIRGAVPDGMSVAVLVNATEGWAARQDGRPIEWQPNKLGFLTLGARPASATNIVLEYRGTREQRIFALLSIAAWIAAVAGLFYYRRRPFPI